MPQPVRRVGTTDASTTERLHIAFGAARERLGIPFADDFPPEVLAEAERAADGPIVARGERIDATDLPLVTIDPPGSRDLDQAAYVQPRSRPSRGWRVHYAIADVAAFVPAGGPIDLEARRRGVTAYSPDERALLHPPIISENVASLLPGQNRPALLWTIDLDRDGAKEAARLERAVVRSREQLTYAEAQHRIEAGDELLVPIRHVGEARFRHEITRGGLSLSLPGQEIHRDDADGFVLRYECPLPVEDWNAQLSLLAGMAGADLQIDAGLGLLRTLPAPDPRDVDRLRRQAAALGVAWPHALSYPEFMRTLDPHDPTSAALSVQAARTLRGAGYLAFGPDAPLPADQADWEHGAIAARYAHVTAPLRRLVDRFSNEVILAHVAGREVPEWAAEALTELPSLIQAGRQRARALDRAIVDLLEAEVLAGRLGERFPAVVIDDAGKRGWKVQLSDPAVLATAELGADTNQSASTNGADTNAAETRAIDAPPASIELGSEVTVELTAVDRADGSVTFMLVDPDS